MRFRVLGTVVALGADGAPVALGDRGRALLAALLARAGEMVPAERLADLLWGGRPPASAAAALHSQVARLRRALPGIALVTRPPGYALEVGPGDVDAGEFDRLVAAARYEEALALWQGPAYAEFADAEIARFEAIRLEEARLTASEGWHEQLLDRDRPAEALPLLEAFVGGHPLRETAIGILVRVLYRLGRHADALSAYDAYADRLADELGLEPSEALQRLRLQVLRREVFAAAPPRFVTRYITTGAGRIAVAAAGTGPRLVALPGWVSSIDVIASGRDPRSSLLHRLTGAVCLTLYDRFGTGLSRGPVTDFGLDASVDELAAVVSAAGPPVDLLAMSQAGPVALALAARQPALVRRLVLFGTYADASVAFTRPDLNASLVSMIRAHWGLGSRMFAELYRPDVTDDAALHLARVLRDSADREVAAAYLAATYEADVADVLPSVAARSLVLHYRGDRVVPFAGGRQLAERLPGATFVPLDGRFHLPDARDLDRVVATITDFLV
ncbi:BTAD domain-containing putative transcriptional regulator [Dactylosporangium sp. NPDC005572]|uniref:alpha/beta fold hydrolase n=1 Tax=Dactylosporangium sp. NPDC005572 TaxID=3156889 RepID=UPI0033AAE9B0